MSQLQPFFSIIIPTFNRADLLPKAIESVLYQSFDNWELIVVDDGSTDNTAEVVRGIKDERVRYIYQANAERSAARNKGIEHSTGRYICFLDSDDYYLTNRLALLQEELNRRNCPLAMFFTGYIIDKYGKTGQSCGEYDDDITFDNIAANVIHSQQVCISSEILREHRYDPRFRIGEDMELWLRIVAKYPITYLKENNTVVVVDHDDRSVNVMRYNTGEEQLKLFKIIFSNEHPGKNIPVTTKQKLISNSFQSIAKYHIYQHNRIAAIIAIVKAISSDQNSVFLKFRFNILLKLITFSSMDKLKELIQY